MTEIIAINHVHLTDPRISPCLQTADQTDLQMLQKFCQICQDSGAQQLGLMPRTGINNLPFHNKFIDIIGASVPAYNPLFADSWSEVTDARAKEIEQLILSKN